ncbi:MAG: magnesium and cobalt transport protein CorA [Sphingobacteriales bacterium]|nr:MAG: magnesium and cobalt transport protein CorA [Sphingobacteriales bacterium]TAF78388.1 MAG: magnesium and cobalt transport protein CorA [Sphingobacteriales bacterium]
MPLAKHLGVNIVQLKNEDIPGETPGSFKIIDKSFPSKLFVYAYNHTQLYELETNDANKALDFIQMHNDKTCWMDVKGLGSQKVLNILQNKLNINVLTMEDIVKTYQRPKFDEYENYIFVTSRMLELGKSLQLKNEQLSFILFDKLIISFQEDYDDILDPVRNRLRKNLNGNMRKLGPSYMLYALIDTVIDHYFVIINRLGDELEMVEEHLYQKAHKYLMYRIQDVKKLLISMRRASWPERDKLNDILRSTNPLINPDALVFFRDAYDHTIQIIDLIESYKEISTSLLDLYLSMISNKMNEIMKFLTIVSVIFMPLTFIAGIYGMNFSNIDPNTGKYLPHNMPELYWPNGYPFAMCLMVAITLFQVWYFAKKGWFKN